MSAEVLRQAAALMRERAKVATPGPWLMDSNDCCVFSLNDPSGEDFVLGERTGAAVQNMHHAASWHPAVALAVAGWLDYEARDRNGGLHEGGIPSPALAVATAYLGSDT